MDAKVVHEKIDFETQPRRTDSPEKNGKRKKETVDTRQQEVRAHTN